QPGIFQGKGSGDGIIDFLFLPSLVTHGTLDIRRADADAHFWVMPVINGRMTNHFPIGPPILWSPMYLLSLGIEKIVRPFGRLRGQPFGVNAFSYWMCGLATLLWSLVGIRAVYRLCERHLGRGPARVGILGAVLGTPIIWHIVTQPLLQHALSFALCSILVERWDAWRAEGFNLRRSIAMGALGGLVALVRQ